MHGILGSSVGSVDGSSTYIGYLVGTIDCDINLVCVVLAMKHVWNIGQ